MNWMKNHIRLMTIMIVIVLLVTIIVVSSHNSGSVSLAENAAGSAATLAEEPVADAGNGLISFFSGLIHFRSIQKENYRLKQELSDLNLELAEQKLTEAQLQELRDLYNSLNYSSYDDDYQRVTADVVAADESDIFNTFTINAGERDGIDKDDLVVDANGLVGRIYSTGDSWAQVVEIVDSSNSVSFSVVRDPEITGIISGDGEGALSGYVFDETKSIIEGDTLVTSGMGSYPAGVEIGRVTSVSIDSNSMKKTVDAEASADFKSMRIVAVLTK